MAKKSPRNMARYQIIFTYDGTQFTGSQRQAKSRTAQSVLEDALRNLGWEGRSILLAGRTDTGVHASGQVAAVDLNWIHPDDKLRSALNSHLPYDMAVQSVRRVDDRFHPRFDAISRHYRYRLYGQPVRDPLRDRYSWRIWPAPDEELLHAVAGILTGTHDFSAFGSPPRANGSTVRTVTISKWTASRDEWIFDVVADAFLYRMVRRLVYVQVAVGQGKVRVEAFQYALEGQDQLPAGLASPAGLTLVEVKYPIDDQIKK
jgi:tRNA pseudouridine38-40 synthase